MQKYHILLTNNTVYCVLKKDPANKNLYTLSKMSTRKPFTGIFIKAKTDFSQKNTEPTQLQFDTQQFRPHVTLTIDKEGNANIINLLVTDEKEER